MAIVSAMTMRRREDHLRSIDLERHQIRMQCAFQRAEPKDTCDDRPQTPTSHRGREAGENQEQTGDGRKIRVAEFASRRNVPVIKELA
jgi:hypothetical protein